VALNSDRQHIAISSGALGKANVQAAVRVQPRNMPPACEVVTGEVPSDEDLAIGVPLFVASTAAGPFSATARPKPWNA